MKYATFINFTSTPFTAYWNGRAYTFNAGQKKEHLNEMIAKHFAKHLANQVLTQAGKERYCSPKKPLEVPEFMEVFDKAFSLEDGGQEVDKETGLTVDGQRGNAEAGLPDQPGMNIRVEQRQTTDPFDARAQTNFGPGGTPQVVGTAVEGDDESFEGSGDVV